MGGVGGTWAGRGEVVGGKVKGGGGGGYSG